MSVIPANRLKEMEASLAKQVKLNKKSAFKPSQVVEIRHADSSFMSFASAFVMHENEYFYVFTEHHGNFFYHQDDVKLYTYARKSYGYFHLQMCSSSALTNLRSSSCSLVNTGYALCFIS